MNAWKPTSRSSSGVPNPWAILAAQSDIKLLRHNISEPGRYYDASRSIVLRKGLLICEERRYLWHELVHADRRDLSCHNSAKIEYSVDREAAHRAMPLASLEWGIARSREWHDLAECMKLPEEWVRFRMATLHPAERAILRKVAVDVSTL